MTDLEFDILDELYFVNTFENLLESIETSEESLLNTLRHLLEKKWIKCFFKNDDEVANNNDLDIAKNHKSYQYLATKKGLLAHNSR